MHASEISEVSLPISDNWKVYCHKLYNIEPDNVGKLEGYTGEHSIWLTYFVDDLVLLESRSGKYLLDVSWHSRELDGSDGAFVLRLVQRRCGEFDWINPVIDFRTRSLKVLLQKMKEVVAIGVD